MVFYFIHLHFSVGRNSDALNRLKPIVKRQLNSRLEIEGILLTMVNERTNYARDISSMVRKAYGAM